MVGTLMFKNFETGSYEHMRVTVYEGLSYNDIERGGEFSSCLVSPEKRSIDYDYLTCTDAPRLGMHTLFALCRKAKEFLYENEHVTIADFCINDSGINLRKRSSKTGIYAPVDMKAVLNPKVFDVYKLCRVEKESTYLVHSVRCALLNYCLGRLFDTEEEVFGISGRGLYINITLFVHSRLSMAELSVPKDIRRLIKTGRKRRHMLKLTVPAGVQTTQGLCAQPHMRLIFNWRRLKVTALEYARAKVSGCMISEAGFALSLAEDNHIQELAQSFGMELSEYISNYDFLFKAKSHVDYLDVKDELLLTFDINAAEKISEKAAALSANMKFREKLPCPDYYDSHGRAYNK